MKSNSLLPSGFKDLIFDEALFYKNTVDTMLNIFFQSNYRLINTSILEFAEDLDSSFFVFDKNSKIPLVIRDDITKQISRLLNSRLRDETLPIKLCYEGKVLTNDNLLGLNRQITQVGIESIGNLDHHLSANEILRVIINSLREVECRNLLIEFCFPNFTPLIVEKLKIKNKESLKSAINSKNISLIIELGGEYGLIIANLILPTENFSENIKKLLELPFDKKIKNKIINFEKFILEIKNKYQDIKIVVDLFGNEEFLYHQNLAFKIFSQGTFVSRGGEYHINNMNAFGASIYIDNIANILFSNIRKTTDKK